VCDGPRFARPITHTFTNQYMSIPEIIYLGEDSFEIFPIERYEKIVPTWGSYYEVGITLKIRTSMLRLSDFK